MRIVGAGNIFDYKTNIFKAHAHNTCIKAYKKPINTMLTLGSAEAACVKRVKDLFPHCKATSVEKRKDIFEIMKQNNPNIECLLEEISSVLLKDNKFYDYINYDSTSWLSYKMEKDLKLINDNLRCNLITITTTTNRLRGSSSQDILRKENFHKWRGERPNNDDMRSWFQREELKKILSNYSLLKMRRHQATGKSKELVNLYAFQKK